MQIEMLTRLAGRFCRGVEQAEGVGTLMLLLLHPAPCRAELGTEGRCLTVRILSPSLGECYHEWEDACDRATATYRASDLAWLLFPAGSRTPPDNILILYDLAIIITGNAIRYSGYNRPSDPYSTFRSRVTVTLTAHCVSN